jgi:glycine cleavage system H protein
MAEESYPAGLHYHTQHDWARVEGEAATFGITWFAQDNLQEIVFFDPPQVGDRVTKDEPYAEIESIKAVSEVYAPLSGEIVQVNGALGDGAGMINHDPYGQGWLVKVKLSNLSEVDQLLKAEEYEATIRA